MLAFGFVMAISTAFAVIVPTTTRKRGLSL